MVSSGVFCKLSDKKNRISWVTFYSYIKVTVPSWTIGIGISPVFVENSVKNIPMVTEQENADPQSSLANGSTVTVAIMTLMVEGKNKACLNFNNEVSPTIKQLFEMFFFKDFVVGMIVPATCQHLQANKQHPVTYGEFLHCLGLCVSHGNHQWPRVL